MESCQPIKRLKDKKKRKKRRKKRRRKKKRRRRREEEEEEEDLVHLILLFIFISRYYEAYSESKGRLVSKKNIFVRHIFY
jgi:hypothetical protein